MDTPLTENALLPTILAVDDTPSNLSLITGLLKGRYRVKVANSGLKALSVVHGDAPPDLVLLDVMMPDMDGIEVCRRLKEDRRTQHIPVIFLTSMSKSEDERVGLEAGAVDYITKPISPPILLARVKTHLQLKAGQDFLKDKNAYLESEVLRRTREVQAIQDVTIFTMASLAETRDNETGNHIRRTQHYVKALAIKLRDHPRFVGFFTDATIELLFKSAPLHDIGKVGIPDRILLKPGKLTADEFTVMKTHAALGSAAIVQAEKELGTPVEFLRFAKEIAHGHHEKWDGSGYPDGLKGDAIPIAARLMAVADVYDALISRRVYKPPFPQEKAVAIITEGRGTHFDPDIVDAFVAILPEFQDIARRYADTDSELEIQARRMAGVAGE
jgi:putative two-component system response regulator